MIKLIIYDLDGTLVDSLADVTTAINTTLAYYQAPPISKEKMQDFFGQGIHDLMKDLLAPHPQVPLTEAIQKFRTVYNQNIATHSALYEGLHPMLVTLQNNNISQAVLTNKLELSAKKLLSELHATRYFDPIAGPDTYDSQKPDPKGLLEILKYHNIKKEEAVMVGDSETDIMAAKNAGVPAIAVTYGYRTISLIESYTPDYQVHTVTELDTLLTSLTHGQ